MRYNNEVILKYIRDEKFTNIHPKLLNLQGLKLSIVNDEYNYSNPIIFIDNKAINEILDSLNYDMSFKKNWANILVYFEFDEFKMNFTIPNEFYKMMLREYNLNKVIK